MARCIIEDEWLKAAYGDRVALRNAFDWRSTKEGFDFWEQEHLKYTPMSSEIQERIKYLYAEWKIAGNTREDNDNG